MNVKIWPRKSIDKGGVACMPLRQNVREGRRDWKLTMCPNCQRECWETPLLAVARSQGASALCTECAIRAGINGNMPQKQEQQSEVPVILADRNDIERMKHDTSAENGLTGNVEFKRFMQICEIKDDDVVTVIKDGKEMIYVEKEGGRRMMVKIALAMVQSGRMTPQEADDYLRHGSEPMEGEE